MQARGRSANRGWLQEGMIRGHMLGRAMLPGDEELGKKDDDHRFATARSPGWSLWNHPFRWRRRRTLLVIVGVCVLYFVLSTRSYGWEQGSLGSPISPTYEPPHAYDDTIGPIGPPPDTQLSKDSLPYTYDGRIRFYRLAKTLRKYAQQTNGYDTANRNVLFAMSSLKSVSNLLPLVCDMSKWSRNHVHVAFMGREDVALEDILNINGIDKEGCPAMWHDARPDYTEYSSDARAQKAVAGALSHFQSLLHPQVAIMDDVLLENDFFVRGMRTKTELLKMPLIEVPKDKWERFMWMTRLDTGSLINWHSNSIDILIQVPSDSSNVLRLLKSIENADYSGLSPPRLIIELPVHLDESVKQHVENFKWPSGLIIRRKIMRHRATQEDAAIRFLELFYPASTPKSHVLLLSPQAQLSPLYLHYIMYALLEYKFSSFGSTDSANLMGLSLESPSLLLDGKAKLTLPSVSDMHTERYKRLFPGATGAPFLWQAPNSHATLFFGDKWAELHSFLRNRVVKHQSSKKVVSRKKIVSETLPAWTEYMLEFMRARGYALLYPAASREAFVSIHNELYHLPEEFQPTNTEQDSTTPRKPEAGTDQEPFLRDHASVRPPSSVEPRIVPYSTPLQLALPFDADLPEMQHLPQLLYTGVQVDAANWTSIANEYANAFREEIGECVIPKGKQRKVVAGEADDLFCFGGEEEEWVDDGTDEKRLVVVDGENDDEEVLGTADTVSRTSVASAKPTFVVEADDF
ncbi:hypothetical protein GQ44DRAFT_701617 [Phaeosphaeriaceae sp. PMI808]|nr:hypothetical protein GQ44DRAFT_701617 [Phaeosphaeriaceae sp. PMI808]